MPDTPVAYFITFSTYGTRLHGDTRGTSDRLHNSPGTPKLVYDERRWEAERALMKHAPFRLDRPRRRAVAEAIQDAAAFRRWPIHALNVRTNHVHCVLTASERPESVMSKLKGRATRLLHDRGLADRMQPVWSDHGSTRWLWSDADLGSASEYVNARKGIDLDVPTRTVEIASGRPGDPNVGLCFNCAHSRTVHSGRGSTFWACELSIVDPGYPKYPGLPVLRCRGYVGRTGP